MKKSDVVLMVFLVFSVFLFIASRLGASNFLVVLSGSMEPTINMGDMVVTTPITSNAIKVGDIVAFNDGKEFPITHRVINITEGGFITKGDANEDPDPMVRSSSSVVGKIAFWVPFAGYIVYFARGIYGLLFLIVVPGFVLIIIEIKNIFNYFKEDKVRKRKIEKSNRLLRSIILILSFSLLASQAIVFSSNGITSAYFSDVEAGKGYFEAWTQEAPPPTINKWWSDTEFVPMSDPRYDNSFNVVVLKKSSKVTSTNPGGFYINIKILNVPATNSISITDAISGEIRSSGDFVKWPMFHGNPLHVYLNGIDIINKFDWNFDNKILTVNLKSGESIDGGELYITLHLKYALIGTKLTKDEKTLFPRVYTNLASATINGNRIDSSPATLTAHLKFSSCSCSRSCEGSDIKIDEDVDSEVLGTLCENDCDFEYYIIDTTVEGSGILGGMQTETDMTSPLWLSNSINSTLAGTPIEHSVLWSDESLSGYIFSFDNCEGLLVNDTWISFADNWSNVTKTVNSTVNCTINWMVYANDTSNNWNATDLFSYNTTEIVEENTTSENITYYNYSDTTNNKIKYSYNESLEEYPTASLDTDYGEEANSSQYPATLAYEGGVCNYDNCFEYTFTNRANKTVWHSFVFKINENVNDVKSINISWAGYSESNLIDSKFRVITNTGYEDASGITNENQIYIFNITSNFDNYLSSGYLRFQVWTMTDSLSDSINLWTDFVSVTVTT
jgi:signal peptidase